MSTLTYDPPAANTTEPQQRTEPKAGRPRKCDPVMATALEEFYAAHRRAEDTGDEYWRDEAQHSWEKLLDVAGGDSINDRQRVVRDLVEDRFDDDAALWYEPHAWCGKTFQPVPPSTEPADWSRGRGAA